MAMWLLGAAVLVIACLQLVQLATLSQLLPPQAKPVTPVVIPIQDAPIGHVPTKWPEPLSSLANADVAVLVVLSPTCQTCDGVAPAIRGAIATLERDAPTRLVVPAISPAAANDFIDRHRLNSLNPWIDVNGDWMRYVIGVTVSPSYVVLAEGRLSAAASFNDATTALSGVSSHLSAIRARHKETVSA